MKETVRTRAPYPVPRGTGQYLVVVLVAAAATVVAVPRSHATGANDLCSPAADPCIVSTSINATPGSVIDVGQRELRIIGSGAIHVSGGGLTLRGRRIATGTSTLLRTSGARRSDPAAPLIIEAQQVELTGEIDVRGAPAGAVDISATESITMTGRLRGRSEAAGESASSVSLIAATVLLIGAIELDGGADEFGGDLTVDAASITLSGSVIVSGGDGGSVEFSATDSLLVALSGTITADATTASGDGGEIALRSDRVLRVAGRLSANGRNGAGQGGGDGGSIVLAGDESVILPDAGGFVRALAGSPDGSGGEIEISSLAGSVEINGTVNANGDSLESTGGAIEVSAETSLDVIGTIMARGALGGGGDIDMDAGDWARVRAGGLIDASVTRSVEAGRISLNAGTAIEHLGRMLANSALSNSGTGGSIELDACSIAVRASGEIRCRGPRGNSSLVAAGAIVVNGTIATGPSEGVNIFRYPSEGPLPVTTGANIAPAPTFDADPALVPCVPLPATPTPIATATPTPSHSPTPTASPTVTPSGGPLACRGDCDDNGRVSIAELVRAVNIALGDDDVASCRAADTNGDGLVSIGELIQAVNSALFGCGA